VNQTLVEEWFRERGFGVVIEPADDGSYWASLTRLPSGRIVAPDYGHGESPEDAANSAKGRYEVEQ
jgi:predicted RNase H-like HicB family nuclease